MLPSLNQGPRLAHGAGPEDKMRHTHTLDLTVQRAPEPSVHPRDTHTDRYPQAQH